MSLRCRLATAFLVFFVTGLSGIAQERPAEARAEVPALTSFHKVIFRLWHEAWPNKDAAMLRELMPQVDKGISEVAAARLPGILHEKQAAWDKGVQRLQAIGSEYKAAATGKDDAALLASAEKLHSQFEMLVRTIRPAIAELDAFHGVLYMLYHHYLPQYSIREIRSSALELKQKMSALNSAKLPDRLKQKESEFIAARARLSAAVDALERIVQVDAEPKIKDAVNSVHSEYEALQNIFE